MVSLVTEEQQALQHMARTLLADLNPPSHLRELHRGDARSRELWSQLARSGLTAIGIPEEDGGAGGDARDVVIVLEEAGRALLAEPYSDTVAVAVPALRAGPRHLAAQWLPAIASGETMMAVSMDGRHLRDADAVDAALIATRGDVRLVEARDIRIEDMLSTEDGSRRTFRIQHAPDDGTIVSGVRPGDVASLGALATAAQLTGVSHQLLDMTVEYARTRRQFGVPIGSFQAIRHALVDVYLDVERVRDLSHAAAAILARRGLEELAPWASKAKTAAVWAARSANLQSLQTHAGIGFTWEHDLHLWLKRAQAWQAEHGDDRFHARLLADTVMGPMSRSTEMM